MSDFNMSDMIIHEIVKETGDSPVANKSDQSIKNNNIKAVSVAEKLCRTFKSNSLERAIFNSASNFTKSTHSFKEYDFNKSTKKLVDQLESELKNTNAKGGFLVFFEHKSQGDDFFSVFLVRNTDGFIFQENNTTYEPEPTEYIDLENVAMGARINLTKYLTNSEERYITLVRGNTDISGYFRNWIGVDKKVSEQADCKNLLFIANNIDLPKDMEREDFKRKIGEYAKNSQNNRITLSGLSEHLYGDREHIQNYAENNGIDIDTEFTLKGKYLHQFFKINVEADGIKFSAKREYFDSEKLISMDHDNKQIIIKSKKLYTKVSEQL